MMWKDTMIDDRIKKAEDAVVKTKAKYDEAVAVLEELLAKKRAMQNEELLRLFANSNKGYDEVTAFLTEGMTEEQMARGLKKKPGRKPRPKV